ncbi:MULTISPECIES: hypothetical protein [Lysinibacillus]|uniref:Uncharacterized protein n=1 Tax=Lysinibacillus tabacifolii TaxID=1173107 RepID=A0ABY2T132_9BACI|nr:hypothetical protein [Lysinibacillus tabacifolii]TKI49740.1 hypothetical protein FC748_00490 [Lysinibacillus tabacifolii]TKI49741.1 hypothetical protein FC748_00495 [Lysinibacillus tabacifolii]
MASYFDKVEQEKNFLAIINGSTDVDKYVSWSTYIEFCHGYKDGTAQGTRLEYTAYLQYWDGSSWTNVDHHTGYFSYSSCFNWSLTGRKAGSYRIRTVYYFKGSSYVNRTSAFIVER